MLHPYTRDGAYGKYFDSEASIDFGADLVVHSTTKYINGHSDVVGGAVVAKTPELHERLTWWANALGLTGSPFDAFLTLRGLRTLDARLRVHEENTHGLLDLLEKKTGSEAIRYPIIHLRGEDVEIAFNVKYLLDGLKALPSNEIQIQMNNPTSPAVLVPIGASKMTYLLMPVQIRN
jgi:O-acetylhomoserine/O-acetylserine sulfhydrylase-like pyridoxal-dependent enzyme